MAYFYYNIFIHAYKYIASKMCTVLNMVHSQKSSSKVKLYRKNEQDCHKSGYTFINDMYQK